MVSLARWQAHIVDQAGNIQPGALITVLAETVGTPLATLFSDRAGAVGISNPFAADATGFAAFHTAGGVYQITATFGGSTRVWRYVGIGTGAETDVVPLDDQAALLAQVFN
jgi:N12 class adenine-specific DNA methylase